MSPVDILILILAFLCIGSAIAYAVFRKKRGCGGCNGCSHHSICGKADRRH